jgi:hypothetical protein
VTEEGVGLTKERAAVTGLKRRVDAIGTKAARMPRQRGRVTRGSRRGQTAEKEGAAETAARVFREEKPEGLYGTRVP